MIASAMRYASVTLLVAATLLLTACGGGGDEAAPETTDASTVTVTDTLSTNEAETETNVAEPDESPGEFLERVLGYELKGQYGRSWDVLHPGHQAVVTRDRYEDCRSERFGGASGEIESFKVQETYEDPLNVPGIPERSGTAVTLKVVVRSGDDKQTYIDTAHAIQVGDHWVWLLTPSDFRDYKAGNCPT